MLPDQSVTFTRLIKYRYYSDTKFVTIYFFVDTLYLHGSKSQQESLQPLVGLLHIDTYSIQIRRLHTRFKYPLLLCFVFAFMIELQT